MIGIKLFLNSFMRLCLVLLLSVGVVSAEPLRVGVIQSLTGIAAEDGNTALRALKLAEADINSSGNSRVELVVEDDATDPKMTVSAFKKLSAQGVKVIIGSTWSFTMSAILPLAKREQVILINTTTLPESYDLKSGGTFAFANSMTVNEQATAFEKYLDLHTIRRAAIVSTNNTWGEVQRVRYLEILQQRKIEVIESMSSTTFDVNEWAQLIPRLKSKNPDLTLLLVNRNDIELFLRRAREVNFKSQFFASKHTFDAFQLSSLPALYEEVCFSYPLQQLSQSKKFLSHFTATFGERPKMYADNSYDALFLVVEAHKIAQSKNIPLHEALKLVRWDGIGGHYQYSDSTSFSTGKTSLVCIKDQTLQTLE